MQSLIVDKKKYGSLISPQRNQCTPIYNWHSFKHSYSKELVDSLISEFKLKKGAWVLDPYCGGGTTLLACKQLGINSIGFDILPFSVFLSNVKIENYDDEELVRQLKLFRKNSKDCISNITLPDIPLVKKAFQPDVRKKLLLLKQKIEEIHEPKSRNFFNLGFLSILESVSNTSKAGGFLRIVNRDVSASKIRNFFLDKVADMISDTIKNNNASNTRVHSKARIGDARKLPTRRKYDAVITSPPYPNRHDYTRIYFLEMIFDFISNNDELKKIRYETIRSHVEAKKKYEATDYNEPPILDELIGKIEKNGTNNSQVTGMLRGYFEDMYLSLSEMYRCLKNNAKIGLVVSNVRFAGVNIPVDEILSGIGNQVGLKPIAIWVARYRGNSSQQMRAYNRKPSRESVIIWQK